jgi:hypothetical protein
MIEPIPFAGCIEIEDEMPVQEDALKLADELEIGAKRAEDHGTLATRSIKAANLLRQQHAEIEALKAKYKQEFEYVENILKDRK